jgi:hypothetical protein
MKRVVKSSNEGWPALWEGFALDPLLSCQNSFRNFRSLDILHHWPFIFNHPTRCTQPSAINVPPFSNVTSLILVIISCSPWNRGRKPNCLGFSGTPSTPKRWKFRRQMWRFLQRRVYQPELPQHRPYVRRWWSRSVIWVLPSENWRRSVDGVFDLFSVSASDGSQPILAETWGRPFRIYATKQFPGLEPSTELTKVHRCLSIPRFYLSFSSLALAPTSRSGSIVRGASEAQEKSGGAWNRRGFWAR